MYVDTEFSVRDICGVPVYYFQCFEEHYAEETVYIDTNTLASRTGLELLTYPTVQALATLLAVEIDAVVVVNTYGDVRTDIVLEVVQALKAIESLTSMGEVPGMRFPRDWQAPRVLMDLPNLSIPGRWYSKIDGLIAPSRSTGLHASTTELGLVFVIDLSTIFFFFKDYCIFILILFFLNILVNCCVTLCCRLMVLLFYFYKQANQ